MSVFRAPGADRVRRRVRDHAERQVRYLHFYKIQQSLPDAISKAALAELPGGGRFFHQRRISREALVQARDVLIKLDYGNIRTFAELYEKNAVAIRWQCGHCESIP